MDNAEALGTAIRFYAGLTSAIILFFFVQYLLIKFINYLTKRKADRLWQQHLKTKK